MSDLKPCDACGTPVPFAGEWFVSVELRRRGVGSSDDRGSFEACSRDCAVAILRAFAARQENRP
jgi:hypothetical protein